MDEEAEEPQKRKIDLRNWAKAIWLENRNFDTKIPGLRCWARNPKVLKILI